jgi:hypothetical protein
MAITRTLQNASSESAESVNIAPFDRDAWVETDTDSSNRGVIAFMEHRVSGDDPEYPLVRRVEIRSANLYHPGRDFESQRGRKYTITVFSTQKIEDSVSGLVSYMPVQTTVQIAHAGTTILNAADVLDMLLSTAAELYDSVDTGTPDSAVISKLALGAVNI